MSGGEGIKIYYHRDHYYTSVPVWEEAGNEARSL